MKPCLCFSIMGLVSLVFVLVVCAPALHAQNTPPGYTHQVFTTDDGLPTNLLTGLVQTPEGYLWIGSQDGLVRYDGTRFTVFNSANTDAFTNNRIFNLWSSSQGDLWVHTGDFSLLHYRDGRFARLDFGGENAYQVWTDTTGSWIATQTRLFRYHEDRLDTVAAGLWDEWITALVRTRDGTLWVVGDEGTVIRFVDGAPRRLPTPGRVSSYHERGLLHEAADGAIWIGAAGALWRFGEGRLIPVPVSPEISLNSVTDLGTDSEGNVLLEHEWGKTLLLAADGTYRELPPTDARFQAHSKRYPGALKCFHGPAGACFMGDRPITQIPLATAAIQDHEGGFWIASIKAGLYYLRPALITAYSEPEGLSGPIVYALTEAADGALWTVNSTDLYRFEGGAFEVAFPFEKGRISTLYTDRAGTTWFLRGGLVYRIEAGRLAPFARDTLPPAWSIYHDAAGAYWFATNTGLYAYQDGRWMTYSDPAGDIRGAYQITGTRDGAVWILPEGNGLRRFHQGRFHSLDTVQGFSFSDVRHLYDDDDFLWVATGGRGLHRLDLRDVGTWDDEALSRVKITSYRARNGLFDEVIHRLVEDDHGRLWMSTNRGIFWVKKDELNAFAEGRLRRVNSVAYDTRDGMRDREANRLGGLKDRHGRLWFSTMGGVVMIEPKQITTAPVPNVVIEQVRAGEEPVYGEAGRLTLAAQQRTFEVEYTAPSFLRPERMRFRYKLDGYDKDWTEVERRSVFYTRVPAGRYRFRVQAANHEGGWNEAGASVQILVQPFFFETWWFYLLCALAGAGLMLSGYRYRIRHLHQRKESLKALVTQRTEELAREKEKVEAAFEESERLYLEATRHYREAEAARVLIATQAEELARLDKAKSRFFANISHEFRTPLTLQIGPLQDILEGRHGPLTPGARDLLNGVLRSSERLLRLVGELLDLARLEAGSLTLNACPGDLAALVEETARAFRPLAAHIRIIFRCETTPLPDVVFDRNKLEKVLVNLLSNAFKFTPAGGQVMVTTQANSGHVSITVTDTGRGIAEDALPLIFERFYHGGEAGSGLQASTGLGLGLAQELVVLHGGRIDVCSTLGQGSTFTVLLPADPAAPLAQPSVVQADDATRAYPTSGDGAPAMGDFNLPVLDSGDGISGHSILDLDSNGLDHHAEIDRTTVLIVEDNAEVRRYVRSILQSQYRVLEARDGKDGLQRAKAALPDLIITDVMMPALDGYGFARALKEDPMTEGIPVIMLTARAGTEDQVEGLETGVDAYLTKPFERAVLEAQVRGLITQRQRLRACYSQAPILEINVPPAPARPSAFEARVREVIALHLRDEGFSVERLAAEVRLSYAQLVRKLRKQAGTTPAALIRTVRVEQAARLLEEGAGNVTEIAYAVGFKSLSHFTRCFREHFKVTPSAYVRSDAQSR